MTDITRFKAIFAGLDVAYGTYRIEGAKGNGKQAGINAVQVQALAVVQVQVQGQVQVQELFLFLPLETWGTS